MESRTWNGRRFVTQSQAARQNVAAQIGRARCLVRAATDLLDEFRRNRVRLPPEVSPAMLRFRHEVERSEDLLAEE